MQAQDTYQQEARPGTRREHLSWVENMCQVSSSGSSAWTAREASAAGPAVQPLLAFEFCVKAASGKFMSVILRYLETWRMPCDLCRSEMYAGRSWKSQKQALRHRLAPDSIAAREIFPSTTNSDAPFVAKCAVGTYPGEFLNSIAV